MNNRKRRGNFRLGAFNIDTSKNIVVTFPKENTYFIIKQSTKLNDEPPIKKKNLTSSSGLPNYSSQQLSKKNERLSDNPEILKSLNFLPPIPNIFPQQQQQPNLNIQTENPIIPNPAPSDITIGIQRNPVVTSLQFIYNQLYRYTIIMKHYQTTTENPNIRILINNLQNNLSLALNQNSIIEIKSFYLNLLNELNAVFKIESNDTVNIDNQIEMIQNNALESQIKNVTDQIFNIFNNLINSTNTSLSDFTKLELNEIFSTINVMSLGSVSQYLIEEVGKFNDPVFLKNMLLLQNRPNLFTGATAEKLITSLLIQKFGLNFPTQIGNLMLTIIRTNKQQYENDIETYLKINTWDTFTRSMANLILNTNYPQPISPNFVYEGDIKQYGEPSIPGRLIRTSQSLLSPLTSTVKQVANLAASNPVPSLALAAGALASLQPSDFLNYAKRDLIKDAAVSQAAPYLPEGSRDLYKYILRYATDKTIDGVSAVGEKVGDVLQDTGQLIKASTSTARDELSNLGDGVYQYFAGYPPQNSTVCEAPTNQTMNTTNLNSNIAAQNRNQSQTLYDIISEIYNSNTPATLSALGGIFGAFPLLFGRQQRRVL